MPDPLPPSIICPSCRTNYRWDPAAGGRKVKCKCGAVIRIPLDVSGTVTIERMPGDSYSASSLDPARKPPTPAVPIAPIPDEIGGDSGEFILDVVDPES